MNHKPSRTNQIRVTITLDIYDQSLLPVLIWARRSADKLTNNLWEHGINAHVARVELDDHTHTQ